MRDASGHTQRSTFGMSVYIYEGEGTHLDEGTAQNRRGLNISVGGIFHTGRTRKP